MNIFPDRFLLFAKFYCKIRGEGGTIDDVRSETANSEKRDEESTRQDTTNSSDSERLQLW